MIRSALVNSALVKLMQARVEHSNAVAALHAISLDIAALSALAGAPYGGGVQRIVIELDPADIAIRRAQLRAELEG